MSSESMNSSTNNNRGWKPLITKLQKLDGGAVVQVRKLEEMTKKQATLQNHIIFLTRCRKLNITPKGFQMKRLLTQFGDHEKIRTTVKEMEEKLMKTMIKIHYENLHKIDNTIKQTNTTIREKTPELWSEIRNLINKTKEITNINLKAKHITKLNQLVQNNGTNTPTKSIQIQQSSTTAIENRSTHKFSDSEMNLLKLGLNFSMKTRDLRLPLIETAAAVEMRMMNEKEEVLPEYLKNNVRAGISHIMKNSLTRDNYRNKWDSQTIEAIKSIKQNKDIVIGKADKGNCIVVMNKTDYHAKMEEMISDGPYTQLPHDPTETYSKKVEIVCNKLLLQNKITKAEYGRFIVKDARSPIIYGAPKIHKDNCPLRPSVDFRKSPTYKIAKYLSQILKTLSKDHHYTIKNSFDFVKQVKNIKIHRGDVKASFDVKSLFTTVPIPETLIYIKEQLDQKYEESADKLSKNDIMELLKICLSSTYFQYKDMYFHQKGGTAMGSPISPIVAELFLQMLEMKIIHQNRDIRFWRRFVDDAFIIAKGRKLKSILDKLNNFNPAIEFTLEEEKNGKLAFLDTMLYDKIDGKIGHYVHRKPTHTNKYLDYQSFHPNAHKISVCDTLLRRAIILCDDDHVNEEIEFVTNTLKSNGYPNKMIQRRLQIVKEKISHPQEPSEIQKRVILPWAGKPTTRIAQFLRRKLSWEIGYYPGQKEYMNLLARIVLKNILEKVGDA
ncbi:uncharacterized protein LOC110859600 [Folsomia candida]|uniref:uncharacterized protein LOC110859600 n=1 Tax=Folsomia candida TaxID=158441 RepID=UPI000B8F9588|nr:uncharacterized protein LOC110859600 [Folsomia candida]